MGDQPRISEGTLIDRKNGNSVTSLDDRRKFFQKAAGGLATVLAAAVRSRATATPRPESGQVREIREPSPNCGSASSTLLFTTSLPSSWWN